MFSEEGDGTRATAPVKTANPHDVNVTSADGRMLIIRRSWLLFPPTDFVLTL